METKQEFMNGLRRALTGKISQSEVEEHIRYYDDYITAETRKTGDEKAVLNALGSPNLIAMSICAADAAEDRVKNGGAYNASEGYYNDNNGYQGYEDDAKKVKDSRPFIFRHPKLTIGLIIAGIILLIVLFIGLAFSLLKFLWPAIVAALVIILGVRLIIYLRDNL